MRRLLTVSLLFLLALPAVASAQATRTWVSHNGDDVNPCSISAPCKTWAGAISKTAAGGEIDALDPGGYGSLTITKSITINGNDGGSTLNSGGINGFVVNMASNPGDAARRVVLRNLDINGAGTTLGLNGVRILDAKSVHLEDVFIENQSGDGIDIAPPSVDVTVSLDRVTVSSVGGAAVRAIGTSPAQKLDVLVRNSLLRRAGTGVLADTGATAWLTGVTLFDNGTAIDTPATNGAAGVVNSFCDLQLAGNDSDGVEPARLCPDPPVQTNTVTNNTIVREPAPEPTVVTVTKEAAPVCVVPELVGLKLAAARRGLKAAGCAAGAVKRKKNRRHAGRVLSQKVKPGARLAAGTAVALTVGRR